MTENKRFICESYGCYDIYKDNNWLWSEYEEIENIMNNLDLKARERSKALSKLQKENEQLKTENERLQEFESLYRSQNLGLIKEKNQLREENRKLKSILNEMANNNNEIWLDDGRIFRLKKIFKGEWIK